MYWSDQNGTDWLNWGCDDAVGWRARGRGRSPLARRERQERRLVDAANLLDIRLGLGERRHAAEAIDSALPCIIGGEDEDQVAVKIISKPAQILHPAANVFFRIKDMRDAEARRGLRHELHQPKSAAARHRVALECRFDRNDGEDELRVELVFGREGRDEGDDLRWRQCVGGSGGAPGPVRSGLRRPSLSRHGLVQVEPRATRGRGARQRAEITSEAGGERMAARTGEAEPGRSAYNIPRHPPAAEKHPPDAECRLGMAAAGSLAIKLESPRLVTAVRHDRI